MTLGIVILTEFQKPGARPLHLSPVQASDQALTQGAKVGFEVGTKMLPSRIASRSLSEVMIIT